MPAHAQILRFISDNSKKLGLTHLMLVGDTKDIPMPRLYAAKDVDSIKWGEPGPIYTDFYYSMPDANWDKDGDGRLGEPFDDNIQIAPKLSVGRVPFSDAISVEQYLNRAVLYDSSPNLKNVLQAGALYSFDKEDGDPTNKFTDGAEMMDKIWADILKPAGLIRKTLYECDGIKPGKKGDLCLSSQSLINELTRNDYGIVNWLAHGEANRIVRKFWYQDVNGNGYPESQLLDKELRLPLLLDDGQLFNNIIKSRLIISTACSTADVAGGASTLASAALKAGAGGFVGATAINYFTPGWTKPSDGGNQTITYNLSKNYIEGETIGWALMHSLQAFAQEFKNANGWTDKWLQNVYSFIYLGDPAMELTPITPKKEIDMVFSPPTVSVVAGKSADIKLVFGDAPAIYPFKLVYQTITGITLTFEPKDPIPNQDVKVNVAIDRNVVPGQYSVFVTATSNQFKGSATLMIIVKSPPPLVTELVLLPDYTFVAPKQEFWLDLLISPSLPVDSISAQLEYDETLLEFVKMRAGEFATSDYRCFSAPNPIVGKGRIVFSFARNFEKFGVSNPGIAFSFCFKSRKNGISNVKLAMPFVKAPDSSEHLLSDLPAARVNVHDQGFMLRPTFPDPHNTNTAKLAIGGVCTRDQTLIVDGKLFGVSSDSTFNAQVELNRNKNDVLMKIEDSSSGRSLWLRRGITFNTMRELGFHQSEIRCYNNGSCEELDAPPFIASGKLMVPLRYIAEKLGFEVKYIQKEKKIILYRGESIITLWVDGKIAYVNEKEYKLEVPSTISNGRTFVPLRFVSEAIGANVRWDDWSKTAVVTADLSR